MADLGALGKTISDPGRVSLPELVLTPHNIIVPLLPGMAHDEYFQTNGNIKVQGPEPCRMVGGDYSISGFVRVAGNLTSGVKVGLLYRESLQVIASTLSGAGGVFSFAGLCDPAASYMVICVAPGAVIEHNSQIFDWISPV